MKQCHLEGRIRYRYRQFGLPTDPAQRYEGGDSNVGIEQDYLYFLNPLAKNVYYYQLELDSKLFMDYAKRIGGSPNSVLAALMLKTTVHYFSERKDTHVSENIGSERKNQHISAKIAADYRKDIRNMSILQKRI